MIGQNDLKYFIISNTQKYNEVNNKIIKILKSYFYTMKNHCYQITQIENKLNEYNVKGEVKIKQLLENQQNIIKELIKIINDILQENRNNDIKKNEKKIKIDYFPLKQKNIIMNTNLHIIAPSNQLITKPNCLKSNLKEKRINTNNIHVKDKSIKEKLRYNLNKSMDDKINSQKLINQKKILALNIIAPKNGNEFKGALSCLNIKSSKQNIQKEFFGKFLNKEKLKEQKPLKNKLLKSMSTSEITYNPKMMNKNNLFLKTNNISNNNPNYANNNYTIDEEKNDNIESITLINERNNSLNSSHLNENYGNLPHILTKRKKRIKYRIGGIGGGKILLTDKDNNGKKILRVKSAKEIPIKSDFYLNYNSSFPNFTITNSSIDKNSDFSYNKRSNSSLCFFSGNVNYIMKDNNKGIKKIENEVYSVPYINNGKRIIPTRITQEVLNSSYKKLNKYEQKRYKNY
jgi:hypothetical protein